MNDFRLSAFLSVVSNLSFTKAALELNISQPAISKHINELENQYGVQLFIREGNKIKLTKNGERFWEHAKVIHSKYKELEFDMNLLSHNHSGELTIGASTTIAQYVLPSIISRFMSRFAQIKLSLVTGNSQQIEDMIESNGIDIGLVEGATHKKNFHYSFFTRDELVLVCAAKNRVEEVSIEQLKQIPLVLREKGSGTLEVIKKSLMASGIQFSDLNIIIHLGSSEAIKRYIAQGDGYAIVSITAVLDELRRGELKIVDIEDLTFERDFSFIEQQGNQNRLAEQFRLFSTAITKGYNQ